MQDLFFFVGFCGDSCDIKVFMGDCYVFIYEDGVGYVVMVFLGGWRVGVIVGVLVKIYVSVDVVFCLGFLFWLKIRVNDNKLMGMECKINKLVN